VYNILMITFIGNMFLFDNDISEEEYIAIQTIANSERFKHTLDSKEHEDFLSSFLDKIKMDLNISLKPVKISHIIRIK
jgi:hypothetical protein